MHTLQTRDLAQRKSRFAGGLTASNWQICFWHLDLFFIPASSHTVGSLHSGVDVTDSRQRPQLKEGPPGGRGCPSQFHSLLWGGPGDRVRGQVRDQAPTGPLIHLGTSI